jgi:hypothetical protein
MKRKTKKSLRGWIGKKFLKEERVACLIEADDESSGHRLRVAEGDTITAEYEDNTLPDPYTRSDDLDITGTALIGTVVPPLERAPASNARVVDSFGNSLSEVSVDQQVQIEADLVNVGSLV